MKTNILLLSVGTRNKIVQYFKKELNNNGTVVATDSSNLAPALYVADKHYIVPLITDPAYLETILNICKENDIKGVLSLIDPELSLLAKNYQKFVDIGVTPIISSHDLVEMCFNKYDFYKSLSEKGFRTVRSYISEVNFLEDYKKGVIDFPVFVKPVNGSASININKVNNKSELSHLMSTHDNLMIQEYMSGQEIGADVYVDLISGEVTSIFLKKKLKMRAGETDKSVSFKDEFLFKKIKELISVFPYRGVIDIDIFEKNGDYYFSEINPRFGGGYPHAYECGVNIPKYILNNLMKNENIRDFNEYRENKVMMKYSELIVIDGKENQS